GGMSARIRCGRYAAGGQHGAGSKAAGPAAAGRRQASPRARTSRRSSRSRGRQRGESRDTGPRADAPAARATRSGPARGIRGRARRAADRVNTPVRRYTVAELRSAERSPGEDFEVLAILRKVSMRTAKNENNYLAIELGDRTGAFSTNVFSDNPVAETI